MEPSKLVIGGVASIISAILLILFFAILITSSNNPPIATVVAGFSVLLIAFIFSAGSLFGFRRENSVMTTAYTILQGVAIIVLIICSLVISYVLVMIGLSFPD